MSDAWDKNAQARHEQILEGKDITFSKLLVPKMVDILLSLDGFRSFRVLDVGCGTGILTKILSEYDLEVVGIDPSIESIAIARDYNREVKDVLFECVTIEDYGKREYEKFDFAVANMVLQTIADLEGAINGLGRSLKKAGHLLFSIPHPCFWSIIKTEIGETNFQYNEPSSHEIPFTISKDKNPLPSHVNYYHRPLEIYSAVLARAGFSIRRIYEPFPDDQLMAQYNRPWKYPGFLIVLTRKTTDIES